MAQTTLLLIENLRRGDDHADVGALREQLRDLPGFSDAEVAEEGDSSVRLTVTARNTRERDQLKTVLQRNVRDWQVVEASSYSLPKTF